MVTDKVGFAGIVVSHPEMNGPAIAKTSLGVRAISNDVGIAEPEFKTFSIVW